MASAQGIKAGSAYVELLVKDNKLLAGLDRAGKRLQAFGMAVTGLGKKLLALGAGVTAPLLAMGKSFASSGSKLLDMAQRTGISTEALSELGYAADQTGANMQILEAGVRKMQRSIVDAGRGSQTASEAIAALGLDLKELSKLSPEQQFKAIAQALSQVPDPTLKAALALELLGRSGTALLPMMENGAAGIEALQKQSRELGLTFSTADAKAAHALDDALTDLISVLRRTGQVIGAALAGTLQMAIQKVTALIVSVGQFIRTHRELVVAIFKIGAAILATGAGLVVLGTVLTKLGVGLSILVKTLGIAALAFKGLSAVLLAMLSPMGLVIAAAAALGAYLIYSSGAGAKALSWLSDRFTELKEDALAAWQGIADALASGDIGLAARILWLTLKLEWSKGIAALQPLWLAFKTWFLKITYGAFYGALATWEIVQDALSVAWIETTSFLAKTWSRFTAYIQSAWETVQNWLENRWHDLFALFDKSYDAEAAKQLTNRLSQQKQQQIAQDEQAALAQREQERSAQRDQASQQHQKEMARIGGEFEQAISEVTDANAAKIKAAQDAVDQARTEWQKAIAEAQQKRQAKPQATDQTTPPASRLAGLADLLDQAGKQTIGVAGTFNAAAIPGLASGGVADRIAKASEATASNTKRMLEQLGDMEGSEFE